MFTVLVVFSLQLRGFNNREMRVLLARLLGLDPANYPIGRMTYDLRSLRLHGIIERIPHSHRFQLTPDGLRLAYRPVLLPNLRPTALGLAAAFDSRGEAAEGAA